MTIKKGDQTKLRHGYRTGGGGSKHPVYNTWRAMRGRCNDPNNDSFKYYGGRGIKVCERWNIFENFLKDMGEPPKKHQLDRIDSNGNYEPSNCRWANRLTNMRNTSINKIITVFGETNCVSFFTEKYGLRYFSLYDCLRRQKSAEEFITRHRTK